MFRDTYLDDKHITKNKEIIIMKVRVAVTFKGERLGKVASENLGFW